MVLNILKDSIFNLESINSSNKNTPQTKELYDPRTSLMYQVCITDTNGQTQRYKYGVKQINKKSVHLYCHIQKCRANLKLNLVENGELKVGKAKTRSGRDKWT